MSLSWKTSWPLDLAQNQKGKNGRNMIRISYSHVLNDNLYFAATLILCFILSVKLESL